MTEQCENCGKPVLVTDVICWHCGWQRPLPAASALEQENETPAEENPEPFPLPQIAVYGGLMAVALLLLLIIMLILSRQPILANNPDTEDSEWMAISGPSRQFIVELPVNWQWQAIDGTESETISDEMLATAVAPLGSLVDDGQLLFVAQKDPALLVVIKSERLRQLSLDQIINSLRAEPFDSLTVTDSRLINNIAEQAQGAFRIQHEGQDWQCRQRLSMNENEAYLLALCLPQAGSGHIQQDIPNILAGFQLLQRQ